MRRVLALAYALVLATLLTATSVFAATMPQVVGGTGGAEAAPTAAPTPAPGDVGHDDFSYSGSAPTGREPQSKLWFNDGLWWASLYSKGAKAYDIWVLNWTTQIWTDTGVRIDERKTSSADALWDGSHLYIASAVSDQSVKCVPPTGGDMGIRFMRYSYSSVSKTYTLDGSPTVIGNGAVESVAIDKDTTGLVWATWTYVNGRGGRDVWVAHSDADTLTWEPPYTLPLMGDTTPACDDISALVAYNGKIGVMWSNQNDSTMYYAFHKDGDPDSWWTSRNAISKSGWADNHINLKSLQADPAGEVFAAAKTSLNNDQCPPKATNATKPLIILLYMNSTGWHSSVFSTAAACETRPLLLLDPQNRQLYMFATQPAPGAAYGAGGSVMYKETNLDNPAFDSSGPGAPFISLAADPKINNLTSTKQELSTSTGLVVLASDDSTSHYVHNAVTLGPTGIVMPPPVTAPPSSAPPSSAPPSTAPPSTAPPSSAPPSTAPPVTDPPSLPPTDPPSLPPTAPPSSPPGPTTLFTDGFESGSLLPPAWATTKTGDGAATVESTVVHSGTYAAQLSETANTGSVADLRHDLGAAYTDITVTGSFDVTAEGSSGNNVPLFRLFDSSGVRKVSVYRLNGSGVIGVGFDGLYKSGSKSVALNSWHQYAVHVQLKGAGISTVEVFVDGISVYSNSASNLAATIGTNVQIVQLGNETAKQAFALYADDILVTTPAQ